MAFEPSKILRSGLCLMFFTGLPTSLESALHPASTGTLKTASGAIARENKTESISQPPPRVIKSQGSSKALSAKEAVPNEAVPTEAALNEKGRSVLGAPSVFVRSTDPIHQLSPGDRLLMAPWLFADTVLRVPMDEAVGLTALVVGERQTEKGLWLRLRFGGVVGWLPPAEAASALAEEGSARDHLEGWRVRREELVEQALSVIAEDLVEEEWHWRLPILGGGTEARTIRVWSERGVRQVKQLRRLTECLPKLYAKRFGAMQFLQDLPIEFVVFARRTSYQEFVDTSISIDGMETAGFEVDGLVILTMDSDLEVDSVGTAAHEITHALNRLAFMDPPPIWLEEGMAEDMAHSVETAFLEGIGLCRRPGGWSTTEVKETIGLEDGHARKMIRLTRSARARSLLCYSKSSGIDELLELDQIQFVNSPNRRWLYVEALLLVRSLLPEANGRAGLLLFHDVEDAGTKISEVLRRLTWRATERELLDC